MKDKNKTRYRKEKDKIQEKNKTRLDRFIQQIHAITNLEPNAVSMCHHQGHFINFENFDGAALARVQCSSASKIFRMA